MNHNNWTVGFHPPSGLIPQQQGIVCAPISMQGKVEAPPRRALQQLRHNQANVSVLQRLKNFVAPPRPSLKKQSSHDDMLEIPRELAYYTDRTMMMASSAPAHKPAQPSVLQSDDLLAGIIRFCDMKTGLACRCVCKQWKKIVDESGIDPLEAGLKGEELDKGIQAQQLLDEALARVKSIYTPEHAAFIANHLSRQDSVTEEMRVTLVNWVSEVHYKFKHREPSLHLALQLVDRYMAEVNTGRRKYQTVGVTAFLLGCKFEERHNPHVADLSYITDYSSSRQDIVDMEKAMLERLQFDLVQPKPSDFIQRFAKAAGLVAEEIEKGHHTFTHSLILYFIDVAALNYKFCGIKPSDIAAISVSCALQCLGRPAWSRKLAYYTGIESADYLARELISCARTCESSCLKLKYSSSRFGGKAPDGTEGVFTFVRRFLDSSSRTTERVRCPEGGVYV